MTQYLNFEKLEAIDPAAFLSTRPFPHANPQGLLTDEGFDRLLRNMPDISMFEKIFGYRRLGGQEPHNRYALEYEEHAGISRLARVATYGRDDADGPYPVVFTFSSIRFRKRLE